MNFLFIHQNFPGQYRYIARYLADQPGNTVYFITQPNKNRMRGVTTVVYKVEIPASQNCHPFTSEFDRSVRTGLSVSNACRQLRHKGFVPDIIIGHAGWGEMLFIKDEYPDTPVLSYFEFYYHFQNVDVGFDPEFPASPDSPFRLRTKNAVNLMSFDAADWGHTPTRWQRQVHPPELRPRITVLHEGVATEIAKPNDDAWFQLARDGLTLSRDDEVITYVARNLEPYRGFHIFMRALRLIQRRRPRARIVIVGGDSVSYGAPPPPGTTFRELMLREVGAGLDLERIHFLGQIPYEFHLNILQVSSVHVYLTYPFVLSWSFIEAMACGCAIVGSATPPVLEVLEDGVNGLAVDFFSPEEIADRIDEILDHPDRMTDMRLAARRTAVERFDLDTVTLPRWQTLIDDLLEGRRPALLV